jgi:diguanylate cyclase (GGDEF)-like protein/PAS domain S-box-containing protein
VFFRFIAAIGLLFLFWVHGAQVGAAVAPGIAFADASGSEVPLVPAARFVKDPDGTLTPDTALGRLRDAAPPTGKPVESFGFSNAAYWFAVDIRNPGTEPIQRLLVFEPTWLDEVQAILIRPDGSRQVYVGGNLMRFEQRALPQRQINFDLSVPPGESRLLVRIRTGGPFLVGMTLWNAGAFYAATSKDEGYFGLVYGALAALLLFNLVLFLSARENVYAAYVGYLLAFLAMHSTYNGYTYPLLWPDSPQWGDWAHSITIYLFMLAGVVFAIQFLELRTRLVRAYRWTLAFGAALVVSAAVTAIVGGYNLQVSSSVLWVMVYSPFVLMLGVLSLLNGNRAARYFIPATTAGLIGSFVTALTVSGFIPFSYSSYRAVDFGMLIDAILLSLALADRLRVTRREVTQAKLNLAETLRAHENETRLRQDLAQSLNFQQTLFESNAAALFIVDGRRVIIQVNAALCEMLGYERSELIGQSSEILHADHDAFVQFAEHFQDAFQDGMCARLDYRIRRKDGTLLWAEILGAFIELPNGERGVLWSLIDQTTLHEARIQITYQAMHDDLTGLPNRRALERHLPKAIARARRAGNNLAICMFDLDDFKPVNDTWGHEAGDRLLQALAGRLQAQLRESDMLVRLGGDEFVLVAEDLDQQQIVKQATHAIERLHQSVETPFELGEGRQALVGMSMGIALFPQDSEDSDILLRQADAAMYQAKMHKLGRAHWWRFFSPDASPPELEDPFDPYSPQAVALLEKCRGHFQRITERFVETFYAELAQLPGAREILVNLSEAEMEGLLCQQAEHMTFLLDPATTQAMIQERAAQVGKSHALSGVGNAMLVQAMMLYRRLLSEHLNQAALSARDRYRILLTAESRLQDDVQAQIEVEISITHAYLGILLEPMPKQGILWADATHSEIATLGGLPGVQGALLMRLNAEGIFSIEAVAGPRGMDIASVLQTPGREAVADPNSPRGQGLTAQAWRSLRIQSSPASAKDARYGHWRETARQLGVRSSLSVPVVNDQGHSEAVVSLFGAYTNQFESVVMQQFARGLEQRWEGLWLRCSAPPAVLSEEHALIYRQRLFGDGLKMYMQPMVDLQTGALVKVEALARLELADGQVIAPGLFLPLLGQADLARLFRMGLDIVLGQLVAWDRQGLSVDISLNLSPSALFEPACVAWVRDALNRHGVAPGRLTLELLETERIGHQAQDDVIRQLVQVGVHLAMDDLGSGYSSLQRLSALPFDTIKADQSLLAHVLENPVQVLSLIGAIVQMGADFERNVVVEGLESAGLIEAAAMLGAPFGQGYGLARPMPAEEVQAWNSGFRLPIRPGEIHTYLGALAQHWKQVHGGIAEGVQLAGPSPLELFLAGLGEEGAEALAWHREALTGPHGHRARQRLTDWLVDKIKTAAA